MSDNTPVTRADLTAALSSFEERLVERIGKFETHLRESSTSACMMLKRVCCVLSATTTLGQYPLPQVGSRYQQHRRFHHAAARRARTPDDRIQNAAHRSGRPAAGVGWMHEQSTGEPGGGVSADFSQDPLHDWWGGPSGFVVCRQIRPGRRQKAIVCPTTCEKSASVRMH
jgi:hypothetical protein